MFLARLFIFFGLSIGVFSITPKEAFAANIQPSISLGMSFFQQELRGLISQTGYYLYFQVEEREKWFRPSYGGMIEFSTNGNMLIDGQMLGGAEIVANGARYVKPFIGGNALVGWATFNNAGNSYVGLIYGVLLVTGVEIRLKDKDRSTGLRVGTQWRLPAGTIGGGLRGSDLKTVQLSIGLTF
jgi:hypothetical protein